MHPIHLTSQPTFYFRILLLKYLKECEYYSYMYKENLVILQSIGIIVIKSKETRVVTYTCKYFSGHLIPNSSWHDWIIGIKCLLKYLQVHVTTLVSLLIITMIPNACKIIKFFLILVCLLFWKHIILWLVYITVHDAWKQRMASVRLNG